METGEYWLKPQVKKAKEEKEKLRKVTLNLPAGFGSCWLMMIRRSNLIRKLNVKRRRRKCMQRLWKLQRTRRKSGSGNARLSRWNVRRRTRDGIRNERWTRVLTMKSRITACSVVAVAVAAASNKFVCLGPALCLLKGNIPISPVSDTPTYCPPPSTPLPSFPAVLNIRPSFSMASARIWQPPAGTHNVIIGPTMQAALDSLDGPASAPSLTEYYSVNCMPLR